MEGQFIYICCPGCTTHVRKPVPFGAFETAPRLLAEGMTRFALVSLTLACLPLLAQEDDARNKFIGKWEARWKDQVICTIRLERGDPISGETQACSIHVDENGDLQAPDSSDRSDEPTPILNARLRGEMLTFEEKDGDEVMKFELRLVGERAAELTLPDAPVRIKPIPFARK